MGGERFKEQQAGTFFGDFLYQRAIPPDHFLLESKGLHSAIRLNDYRTKKKDPNKQVWQRLQASPEYPLGLKERYKIERKFGQATSPGARPGKQPVLVTGERCWLG